MTDADFIRIINAVARKVWYSRSVKREELEDYVQVAWLTALKLREKLDLSNYPASWFYRDIRTGVVDYWRAREHFSSSGERKHCPRFRSFEKLTKEDGLEFSRDDDPAREVYFVWRPGIGVDARLVKPLFSDDKAFAALEAALEQATPFDREVLREMTQGKTLTQIAAEKERPIPTVCKVTSRLRRRFFKALEVETRPPRKRKKKG